MNFFEKFLHFFEAEMERPTNYSWFHLMFFGIVILTTVFFCLKFRDTSDKAMRRIVLTCWIVMVVLEIYKQLSFSLNVDENSVASWSYLWYAFPYQLCSTPLYVLPFIAFMKDSKIRDCFIAYMVSFSFFGGIAVYFYPNDVFISEIAINIQTMVHHGIQVFLGIFLFVYSRRKANFKFFLKGIPVFAVLVAIAIISNEAVYAYFQSKGITDTFNMFYISRHFDCTLPILSDIYKKISYLPFVLIYIFGFVIVSAIVFFIQLGITKLVQKISNSRK